MARALLMLKSWEEVKTVLLDTRQIIVVTASTSRKFKFKNNSDAKAALEDWLSLPNARPDLCCGAFEISATRFLTYSG